MLSEVMQAVLADAEYQHKRARLTHVQLLHETTDLRVYALEARVLEAELEGLLRRIERRLKRLSQGGHN